MPAGLSAKEIDAWVRDALAAGKDLYHLEEGALSGLDADVVVTQDLCAVCAVDVSVVDDALAHLGCDAKVVTVDPHNLGEVYDSVLVLGELTGRWAEAGKLLWALRRRLDVVVRRVANQPRPRTVVLEWTDPPFAPGHWVPEMVGLAGGNCVVGLEGVKSFRIGWSELVAANPEVVVCAPCGYDLDGASELATALVESGRLPFQLPVWAVDANASFARPGPRLIDGVEALAAILHPDLFELPTDLARQIR
jgi:iron complex transport system substrate-binding protein